MTAVTGGGSAVGGLGGPAGFGETMLARADDASLRVDVSAVFENGFQFGGTTYGADQLHVSSNGLVSFGAAFTGVAGRLEDISMPFIAAFHADVDTRLDGEGPESGPVWVDVDPVQDVVTITWQEVGFYRRDAHLTNTFQLQLYDQGEDGMDIVLRYDSIEWTAGALQGGWNGTGGQAALIGWRLGATVVSHAASGVEGQLLGLPGQIGNTGAAGLWVTRYQTQRVVSGTAAADLLQGSTSADLVYGGAGNDTLRGGTGGDLLDGGAGFDLADYSLAAEGVTVSLTNPALNAGRDAAGDLFSGIEGLIGSNQADLLAGNADDNLIDGGAGDDTLLAHAGNDTYIGGAGWDRLDFTGSTTGFWLDLADPGLSTGLAAGDVLIGIEEISGSAQADTLAGSTAADALLGAAGDDLLIGRGGADLLSGGAGQDLLEGGAGADGLYGGEGRDTADHSGATTAVRADLLRPARNLGEAAGDSYLLIEDLGGSGHADTLSGDRGDNILLGRAGNDRLFSRTGNDTLQGGEGDDVLHGGPGADLIDGGAGLDRLTYAGQKRAVRVDLLQPEMNLGGALGDRISGIEAVEGTTRADTLAGDDLANTLFGGRGADLLEGRGGADRLVGGRGLDLASYRGASTAVVADLARSDQNRGEASGDSYASIEGLIGSAHADDLRGDDGRNRLAGGAGADTLSGAGGDDTLQGGVGADRLIGGAGIDRASYALAAVGVTASLATPAANRGDARGDSYDSIEGLVGSAFADDLTGAAGADRLSGGAGDDTLQGGGGADQLTGGAGADAFVLTRLEDAGDLVLDYNAAQGDTLVLGMTGVLRADIELRIEGAGLGQPDRAEALVIHRPTGTTLFTLIDAGNLTDIFVLIGGTRHDLL